MSLFAGRSRLVSFAVPSTRHASNRSTIQGSNREEIEPLTDSFREAASDVRNGFPSRSKTSQATRRVPLLCSKTV
jgi:hypothetical protein